MIRIIATIIITFAVASLPLHGQDWTKESKDRAKRAALHDAFQLVRGDTGKWNDDARLQHLPALPQKPAKVTLDAWADQFLKKKADLTDKDDHWLVFRTEQLNDNDRTWIERIERRGNQITITANQAVWQGKYFRNFTGYFAIGINLGKLEPGKYDVKWIRQPMVFAKFDGDGKALEGNWPKDERPAEKEPMETRLMFTVGESAN